MDNNKKYNLEERTLAFARDVREFVKKVQNNSYNNEYIKQLIRSSGSIGANYIEANEALGQKDLKHRIKISRKEAKESHYWLELIEAESKKELIDESIELTKIFSAIIRKLV